MVLVGNLLLRLLMNITNDSFGTLWKSKLGDIFAYGDSKILDDELYCIMRSVVLGSGYDLIYSKFITFFDDFESVCVSELFNVGDKWHSDTGDTVIIKSFEAKTFIKNSDGNVLESIEVETVLDEKPTGIITSPDTHEFISKFKKEIPYHGL